MMYSAETNVLTVARKQYLYKLKSFSFTGLILMQLIILFFSSSGTGMYGFGSGSLHISVKTYSSDVVVFCTFIWIFVMAFSLTKKGFKNMDFTLVTNRLSSSLSDLGLLATLSIIGGFTSTLSSFLLRFILYFTTDSGMMVQSSFKLPPGLLFQGMAGAVLYLFLIGTAAYLFGMLVEANKLLAFIAPALLFVLARVQSKGFLHLIRVFIDENSLLVFSGKVLLAAGLLFVLSTLIYNRMEVRR